MFHAPQLHGATQTHFPSRPRKSAWHFDITDVIRHTVCPHTGSNHITLEANTPESSSKTLFPALHLYYKLPSSESSSERLFPALHLHYKLATSESSSEKHPKRTLTCTLLPRHARSPQRVAPAISAEGCPRPGQNALSPAFRALDTHDFRRGLRFVVLRRHRPRP